MQSELDERGAIKLLRSLVKQAEIDVESSYKKHRDSAIAFFESKAFKLICSALGYNEKRVVKLARKHYENYEQNYRTKKS